MPAAKGKGARPGRGERPSERGAVIAVLVSDKPALQLGLGADEIVAGLLPRGGLLAHGRGLAAPGLGVDVVLGQRLLIFGITFGHGRRRGFEDEGGLLQPRTNFLVAVVQLGTGDAAGLVLGDGGLELLVVALHGHGGGGAGPVHGLGFLAELLGIGLEILGVALLGLRFAVGMAAHRAHGAARHGPGQRAFHLAGAQAADERAEQRASGSPGGGAGADAVFILAQFRDRRVALRIVIDRGLLFAVLAFAARERHGGQKKGTQTQGEQTMRQTPSRWLTCNGFPRIFPPLQHTPSASARQDGPPAAQAGRSGVEGKRREAAAMRCASLPYTL